MSHIRLLLAAASALALAACAPTAKKPDLSVLPPPETIDGAASAQSAGADFGANTGGTYPYGTAGDVQTSNAGTGGEDATISEPDGTISLKPDVTNETYRIDAESCYSFARAQIAHDARIESDAGAAINDSTGGGIGLVQLRQRMSQYARSNRVPRLFGQCMEAKGYSRG